MRRGRGAQVFLSAHRCPEVDLLPSRPPEERVPTERPPEFTCAGEADDSDVDSSCRSEEEEQEEEDGISDWSEEDLSLHFSPAVVQSDDEESDPESSFECFDVTMETQVSGQEGAPKMVPKRQIQLKKKNTVKQGPAEEVLETSVISADRSLHSPIFPRSDLLLRQHSMPASLNTHVTGSGDVTGYGSYKGLVAGANQGFPSGCRRLQKSLSLDETRAKMASTLIKNVLWRRMQVEQNTTSSLVPRKGGGVAPAPAQRAEDASSHSSSTTRKTRTRAVGQKDSPPPTYQQAVAFERQGSETVARGQDDDADNPWPATLPGLPTGLSQSKGGMFIQPRPPPENRPPFSAQGVASSSQRALQPRFYFPAAPQPPLEEVSCVHSPRNCSPTRPESPAPVLHLRRRPDQIHTTRLARTISGQPDGNRTAGDQEDYGPAEATQELRQNQQQPHPTQSNIQGFQGFLPAQDAGSFVFDATGAAAARGVPSGPAPFLRFDPESRRCFQLEPAPQLQKKTLLDPETGQLIQVVLPAAGSSSSSNAPLYPLLCVNSAPNLLAPAPVMLQGGGAKHTMFSGMHVQPVLGMSPLYPVHYLPITVMTSHLPHCDDITQPCVVCETGKRKPM